MYVLLLLLLSNHMTKRTKSTITLTRIDINRRTRAIVRLIFIRKILRTLTDF
jgi:hypothetical protein